ncbi:DUF6415 family natural product biosynthesis protein [Streptomyces sp. NBC_01462]|uniref:DUF6415 family natural product biosynthesis protein n=1 Tax=Streptomyces sp. NBC_01462 TaxID=2903876 RepID=UPI002E36F121|nr:DUF6415 family natural product biosynthesis protein [Streptomyces sp. NBC_01462]
MPLVLGRTRSPIEAEKGGLQADRLIVRVGQLQTEAMPAGHLHGVGHLRRMAWTVNELLEHLITINCTKEEA